MGAGGGDPVHRRRRYRSATAAVSASGGTSNGTGSHALARPSTCVEESTHTVCPASAPNARRVIYSNPAPLAHWYFAPRIATGSSVVYGHATMPRS